MEIKSRRELDRFMKPTSNTFEDMESSATAAPIHYINSTDISYNLSNTALGNNTNTNDNTYSDGDMIWTVLGPIFMIVFCIFGQRTHTPSSQYHHGAMIRQQAERVWAIQREKSERQAIPIETRKSQINENLYRMKIISKCAETGHCILEAIEVEERKTEHDEDVEDRNEAPTTGEESKPIKEKEFEGSVEAATESSKEIETMSDKSLAATEDEVLSPPPSTTSAVAPIIAAAAAASISKSSMKCPDSPGRTERKPLLSPNSEDSEDNFRSVEESKKPSQSSSNNNPTTIATESPSCYDGFDDDEDVCPICLDNFEVDDVVMWSRYNHGSCSHVFHEDCLLQWLLEQRENECPSCRACFIADPATDATILSSSSTTDTNENSSLDLDETELNFIDEETIGDEGSGDIEEGDGNITSSNNIHNDNNNRDDCSDDLDETRYKEHKFVNKANDSLKKDIMDEMERGCTYMIVKGSVQRVPL